jgi:YggT family protein
LGVQEIAGRIIEFVLWLFILLLIVRLIVEWVQVFARSWQPHGPLLVVLEAVYSATDPPLRAIRRVVPPLRLGGVQLDLSLMLLLIVCYVLRALNQSLLLA